MASMKYYSIQGTEDNSGSGPTGAVGSLGSSGVIASSGGALTTPLVAMRGGYSKKNINFRVITYDVESAIRLVKEKHPDILITSVSLKDKIDCIDPAVILSIFEKGEE